MSIALAAVLALVVSGALGRGYSLDTLLVTVAIMVPIWLAMAYVAGLYHEVERRIDHNFVDELGRIVVVATAWSWIFVLVRSLLVVGATDQLTPAIMWLLMIPILLFGRAMVRGYARKRPWSRRPVAVIGDESDVEALVSRIDRHSEWGLEVIFEINPITDDSFVVYEHHKADASNLSSAGAVNGSRQDAERSTPIPGKRELAQFLERLGIDRAILAGGQESLYSKTRMTHELIAAGMAVDQVSGGPETLYSRAVLHNLEGVSMLSVRPTSPRPFARATKRAIDVILATLGLVIVAPILVWAAIRIKSESKGPVFYRQIRCGLNDEPFELVKLRTMHDGAHQMRPGLREATKAEGNDDVLFKIDDDPRVTAVGGTLRCSSIDEIPQLWNVLKGDMSMVGPRPLVFEEAREARDLFCARTDMKPGIAGPWQAFGRSSIPFEDMIKLDYTYVTGWSMSEDFRLLLRTIIAVFGRGGAH